MSQRTPRFPPTEEIRRVNSKRKKWNSKPEHLQYAEATFTSLHLHNHKNTHTLRKLRSWPLYFGVLTSIKWASRIHLVATIRATIQLVDQLTLFFFVVYHVYLIKRNKKPSTWSTQRHERYSQNVKRCFKASGLEILGVLLTVPNSSH